MIDSWSKQKAVEYLANYTSLSAKTIDNEINRYISWPGQVGYIELNEVFGQTCHLLICAIVIFLYRYEIVLVRLFMATE